MQVTFDIPDDLASEFLAVGQYPSRAALEALGVEGYRTSRFSEVQIREMLGYSTRMEVHALLAEHGVCGHYTPHDLDVDAEASDSIRAQPASRISQKAAAN